MNTKLWEEFNHSLKARLRDLHYTTWAQQAKPLSLDHNGLKVAVPNRFVKDWIQTNFLDELAGCLKDLQQTELPVQIDIDESLADLPLQKSGASEDNSKKLPTKGPHLRVQSSQLNPRYTFDNFVVGSSNQFAHAAAQAVASAPAQNYNPLFLYGGVGLGKTHLLNAIGTEIRKSLPHLRVVYISSEQFMNKLIHSIRFGQMNQFRQLFRDSCDLLLVDDIQFIAGKERTQEEFFHTFDRLYNGQRQIVLSSDRSPNDIPDLEERLRSRFQWGLIADIQVPELETRIAIIKKKAEAAHIELPDDVALFLASNVKSNIRELEGSLIRLSAFASLLGQKVTVELARDVLSSLLKEHQERLSFERVQKIVAQFYQIKLQDLLGIRRTRSLALPRQIAMYLCRQHLGASFPEIGHKFGGKDHSTVVHAVSKIKGLIGEDDTLKKQVKNLETQLGL